MESRWLLERKRKTINVKWRVNFFVLLTRASRITRKKSKNNGDEKSRDFEIETELSVAFQIHSGSEDWIGIISKMFCLVMIHKRKKINWKFIHICHVHSPHPIVNWSSFFFQTKNLHLFIFSTIILPTYTCNRIQQTTRTYGRIFRQTQNGEDKCWREGQSKNFSIKLKSKIFRTIGTWSPQCRAGALTWRTRTMCRFPSAKSRHSRFASHHKLLGMISIGRQCFKDWSFFAVFDGHAGSRVAFHSAENLLQTLLETPAFRNVKSEKKNRSCFYPSFQVREELTKNGGKITDKTKAQIQEGMRAGFLKLDEAMAEMNGGPEKERSGTTAICAILTPEYIFFANLGFFLFQMKF